MNTINIPQHQISPAQALWTVFQNQPESVQADFILLLRADEEQRKEKANAHFNKGAEIPCCYTLGEVCDRLKVCETEAADGYGLSNDDVADESLSWI